MRQQTECFLDTNDDVNRRRMLFSCSPSDEGKHKLCEPSDMDYGFWDLVPKHT